MAHAFCLRNHSRHEICGRMMDGAYAAVDHAIGEVLDAASPDATVIVVSDHGFDLLIGHEHGWLHGPPGVAIVKGRGIQAGGAIEAATIYDIAPTVLALLGAPLPIDQRGRPWLGILDAERLASLPLHTATGTAPTVAADAEALRPRPAQGDAAMRERLRALGYLQ